MFSDLSLAGLIASEQLKVKRDSQQQWPCWGFLKSVQKELGEAHGSRGSLTTRPQRFQQLKRPSSSSSWMM